MPLSVLEPMPLCLAQATGRLRWLLPESTSVREKSPFTNRLTRLAMVPLSSCGQANQAVPPVAALTSSSRAVALAPSTSICAFTCTRSQPSAAGPQEDSAVEPVTGMLL